jgi:tripeptidyl-peptidase-1
MTPEEVIEFFSPAQTTVDVVKEWLISSGIPADRIGHSVNKQVSNLLASFKSAEGVDITF